MKSRISPLSLIAFILSGLGVFLILYFAFDKNFNDGSGEINTSIANDFGSFLSGVVGPIFSLAGFFLLFETLNEQRKASQIQQEGLNDQRKSFQTQQFEGIFFEFLRYHRENLQQIYYTIPSNDSHKVVQGKRVFVELNREFESLFAQITEICEKNYEQDVVIEITYLFHFYGVGVWESSERPHRGVFKNYKNEIIDKIYLELRKKRAKFDKDTMYYGGHIHRLGHYWRHISQLVNYVDNSLYLTEKQKFEYIEMFRAQLTQDELQYLFINSLAQNGKEWVNKYKIIKSIPELIFKTINPKSYYPKIEFEWE